METDGFQSNSQFRSWMFQRSNPWTSLPDLLTGSAHNGADYDNGGGGDDDDDYYYSMFIIITVLPLGVGWYCDDDDDDEDEDEDEDYGEEEEQEEEEEGMTAGTWGVLIDFNPATSHSQRFKQNHRIPKMNWIVSSDKSDWSNRCNYFRLRVQNGSERRKISMRVTICQDVSPPNPQSPCCFHPTGEKDSRGFSYFSGGWLNHQPAHVG